MTLPKGGKIGVIKKPWSTNPEGDILMHAQLAQHNLQICGLVSCHSDTLLLGICNSTCFRNKSSYWKFYAIIHPND